MKIIKLLYPTTSFSKSKTNLFWEKVYLFLLYTGVVVSSPEKKKEKVLIYGNAGWVLKINSWPL